MGSNTTIQEDRGVIRAWTFYDWANSVFPLVINSAIFPQFYEYQTSHDAAGNKLDPAMVTIGSMSFVNTELYTYFVSIALLIVCFTAPILSGIADYRGNKKTFLAVFCIIGSLSCAGLFFFDKNNIGLSMIPFVTATAGYWGSIVFYNAFLPEIALQENQDRVSARGFAMGYLGSSILLIICLVLILTKTLDVRYSMVLVGLWWFSFAQYTLRRLPKNAIVRNNDQKTSVLTKGFRELAGVYRELKHQVLLKRFLRSYFFYNMGVQTVMYMATLFAAKEINWPKDELGKPDDNYKRTALIISILLIQFLGIAGSFLFSWLSARIGNLKTLGMAIFFWICICVSVFLFIDTPIEFYFTAASVGLVMGGIQALSRSTYSKLLPESKDHASYFSFFDVSEKFGIVIGTLSFGVIERLTHSMRGSVLVLIAYFVIGFLFLLFVRDKAGKLRSANQS